MENIKTGHDILYFKNIPIFLCISVVWELPMKSADSYVFTVKQIIS